MKHLLIVSFMLSALCLSSLQVEASPLGQRLSFSASAQNLSFGTTELKFVRQKQGAGKSMPLGTMHQPIGACAYAFKGMCGLSGIFFLLVMVPVLSSATLTAMIGSIVSLSVQKTRFAMGITGLVLSGLGLLSGILVSTFVDGGDFGMIFTLSTQLTAMALSAITLYVGHQHEVLKRVSVAPWFRMSRQGNPTGGVSFYGTF